MTTSVGARSVSNSGPDAGTRPRASSSTRRRMIRGERDIAHGERRLVGERGAGADHDRLRVGAQLVRVGARELRREPARRTVGGRDVRRCSSRPWPRRTDDRCGDGAGTAPGRAARSAPTPTVTSIPAARSRAKPAPATRGSGSSSADDPRHPGRDQRVGARRGAAVVRARLEGDERRRAACAIAGLRERAGLGVRATRRLGRADPDDLAVTHEHAADPGIGRGATAGGRAGRQRQFHRLVVAHVLPRANPREAATTTAPDPPGMTGARPTGTAPKPSPIRTLTVGPGITPGRRPTGGRAFAGLDGPARQSRAGRPSPPVGTFTQPRGLNCVVLPEYQGRPQNCNVF